jgi:hypothetical protein
MGPTHPNDRNDPDALPSRDAWLQSYIDGELAPEERARVEAWLAADPAARSQAEAQRRVAELFDDDEIAEPPQQAWDGVLGRISRALKRHPSGSSRLGKKVWPLVWVAAAAAVFAGVWLGARLLLHPKPDRPGIEVLEVATADDVVIDEMDPFDARVLVVGRVPGGLPAELHERGPFLVASDSEIAIISMDGDDTDLLVVGLPPIIGPLLMVQPGEVKDISIETVKGEEQKQPYLHETRDGHGMPMIMVPIRSARKD